MHRAPGYSRAANFGPPYFALSPSISSIRSSWLYLAMRSLREAEPVLIWPVAQGDGQVGDGRVFGLAAAVAGDAGVAVAVGQLDRVDRLGQRADLVDLDQDAVGDALVDAALQPLGVGDEQVVADQLALARRACRSAVFQPSQSSSLQPSSIEQIGILLDPAGEQVDHAGRSRVPCRRWCRRSSWRRRTRWRRSPGRSRPARPACSRPSRWP